MLEVGGLDSLVLLRTLLAEVPAARSPVFRWAAQQRFEENVSFRLANSKWSHAKYNFLLVSLNGATQALMEPRMARGRAQAEGGNFAAVERRLRSQNFQNSLEDGFYLWVFHAQKCSWMLICLLYTSPSPRDLSTSRMPSSA